MQKAVVKWLGYGFVTGAFKTAAGLLWCHCRHVEAAQQCTHTPSFHLFLKPWLSQTLRSFPGHLKVVQNVDGVPAKRTQWELTISGGTGMGRSLCPLVLDPQRL